MTVQFFQQPIINSPYELPSRHWELDDNGQPQQIVEKRRSADSLPIPAAKTRQETKHPLDLHDAIGGGDERYHTAIINGVRQGGR